MGGKRESLWIGGVGGRLTQCPPTDTLFQVSVPKSWAKILGCKEEFLFSPAKPFKERGKNFFKFFFDDKKKYHLIIDRYD